MHIMLHTGIISNQCKCRSGFAKRLATLHSSVNPCLWTVSSRFDTHEIRDSSLNKTKLPKGVLSHTIISPMLKSASNNAKLPLIAMHGLFGFKSNLRTIVANSAINNDRTVVTVDLRNHGDSFHSNEMSLNDMANDIIDTMDYLDFKNAVLLGHSLGGRVAMAAALHHANRIKSIIIGDVAPVDYRGYKMKLYKKLIEVFRSLPKTDYFDKRIDAINYVSNLLPELTPLELNFLLASFVQNEDGEWYWKINLDALEKHIEDFNHFKVETEGRKFFGMAYFIGGTDSKYIIPGKDGEHEKTIAKLFPHYKLEMIDNATHMLHIDKPLEFTNSVCHALSKIDKDFQRSRFF